MTALLILIIMLVASALLYALVLRPWLKGRPWAQRFFDRIEPLERRLFKKSETILVGRLLWIGGFIVTAYDGLAVFVSGLDITPLTTRIFDWLQIPQDMRSLAGTAFIGLLGLVINRLRKTTTKPLDLVAAPDALPPAAAAAVARAQITNDAAVAAVTKVQP